jgi:hypothetical protein
VILMIQGSARNLAVATVATAKHRKQRILCSELSGKTSKKPQIAQISPIGWMGKCIRA